MVPLWTDVSCTLLTSKRGTVECSESPSAVGSLKKLKVLCLFIVHSRPHRLSFLHACTDASPYIPPYSAATSASICASLSLCISVPVCLSISHYLRVYLSTCLSVCLALSVYLAWCVKMSSEAWRRRSASFCSPFSSSFPVSVSLFLCPLFSFP